MLPLWSTSTPKATGPWSEKPKSTMGRAAPFSRIWKSSRLRLRTGRPRRSLTTALTETRLTLLRNVGTGCCATTGAVTSVAASRPTIPFSHVCFMTVLSTSRCLPAPRFTKMRGSVPIRAQGRAKSRKKFAESVSLTLHLVRGTSELARNRRARHRPSARSAPSEPDRRHHSRLRCRRHGSHPVGLQSGHGAHQHVVACR